MNPIWSESLVRFWMRALVQSDYDEVTKHVGLTVAAFCDGRGKRAGPGVGKDLGTYLPYGDADLTAALSTLIKDQWLSCRKERPGTRSEWTRYSLRNNRTVRAERATWNAAKRERV